MIAGLVLAGGLGTRMGGADKAFLRLGGRALVEHVLTCLGSQVEHLAISANGDPTRFGTYNLPVLPDAFAGRGPLAGVAAGLAWAAGEGAEFMVSVPVDTPFIPENLVARLAPGPSVATHEDRQHHLVALWPVAFRTRLETLLAQPGTYKVREALDLCGARPVAFADSPFTNINSPADLAGISLPFPP
jgi:molybdopterin-guanine dinucleotide biosynthesis protein A